MDMIIVEFQNLMTGEKRDLQIPLHMTADHLVEALNKTYTLNIPIDDETQRYLQAENPVAFLKGDIELQDFGLHDGSVIFFVR